MERRPLWGDEKWELLPRCLFFPNRKQDLMTKRILDAGNHKCDLFDGCMMCCNFGTVLPTSWPEEELLETFTLYNWTVSSTCVFELSFDIFVMLFNNRHFTLSTKQWFWTIVNSPENSTRMPAFWKRVTFSVDPNMNGSKDETCSYIQTITWFFTMNAEIKNGLWCFQTGFFDIDPCDFIFVCQISAPQSFRDCTFWGIMEAIRLERAQNATWTVLSSKFTEILFWARIAYAKQPWGNNASVSILFVWSKQKQSQCLVVLLEKRVKRFLSWTTCSFCSWPRREMVGVTRSGLLSSMADYQWIGSLRNG